MSIRDGFLAAMREAVEDLHANTMQVFLRSPRGGGVKPLDPEVAAQCRAYTKKQKLRWIAHSPYLLNLSKPYKQSSWAVKILVDDLKRCDLLGGEGVVLHMGKALGGDSTEALQIMAENVKRTLDFTSALKVPLLIENTAGQGSEIGYHFEMMAELFKQVGKTKRLACCVDTQHAFAAGYDLSTERGWKETKLTITQTIGWNRVAWIHLNDSKKKLASRVDRHENIGKGYIGKTGLMHIVRFAKKNNIPMVLETPLNDNEKGHEQDLKLIRASLKS